MVTLTEEEKRCLKDHLEKNLRNAAEDIGHLVRQNNSREPELRVDTLTSSFSDDGGFLVVCGSAHRMAENFKAFFRERPEFRAVVQEVLRDMYKVIDR